MLRFSVKLTHQELEGKSNGKVARDTGEQTCARENQHRTERFDQYLNQYKQSYLTWVHNKEQWSVTVSLCHCVTVSLTEIIEIGDRENANHFRVPVQEKINTEQKGLINT